MPFYHPYLDSSRQVLNPRSNHTRRGYSKAQICFFKILHIISSVPPSHSSTQHSSRTGGIAIDLNLRFCSVTEDAEFRCSAENGSDSSAIEANREGEKGEVDGEKSVQVEVDVDGVDHEETKIEEEIRENKEGNEEEEEERGVENEYNCLDLLIEAAKVISGKEESKIEERRRTEGKERWMVVNLYSDDLEKSPVVRTKRGRSHALPYRFRDSVMEPLKRRGRPHTPSSTSASRKRLVGS